MILRTEIRYVFYWRENMKPDDKLLSGSKDMYGIYRPKNTKENEEYRKQGLLHPLQNNHKVYRENYELIYVDDIYRSTTCEELVKKIRSNPPEGFPENGTKDGHIIALSQGGNVEFYYVEEYGAVPVEDFADDFSIGKEKYNDMSEKELISTVLAIGHATFDEINEYEPEYGLKVLNAKIYGSRENGNYKPDSDIDVLLEYEGDLKESEVFNLVNEAGISIAGMKLDINPIRAQESGTIEEFLQRDAERKLTENQEKTVDVPVSEASLPNRLLVDMVGVLATFQQVDTLELLYEKNYFLNLEPVENVIEAVRLIKAEHPEIEVYILSSVLSDSEYALQEKNEWLNQYLPEIDAEHRLFPPCGVNKASYVPDGIGVTDFLLDDYTHNLTLWEPPARGIKLLNGINHTNETWHGNMLRFDKEPRELADNILSVMGGELIQDLKPQSDVDRFKEEFLAVLGEVKEIRKELEDIQKNMKPKVMVETEQKKETVSPVIPRTKNKTSPKL